MARPGTSISRHDSPGATWEMVRARPAPSLAGHVRGYTGWTEATRGPMRRRELPSADVPMILNLGDDLRVGAPGRPGARLGSFVAGIHDGPVATEHAGRSRGVQVDLSPIGARILLGRPMHELAGRAVALDDLLGREASLLAERLEAAAGWDERFALLDAALARRLARGPRVAADVEWAWRRLVAGGGRPAVGELASRLGCSRRHLARRFHDAVGVPPITAARVVRFEAALRMMREPSPPPLARVAAACGYADHAHLSREVARLAGMPPRELMRRSLPAGGGTAG